MKIAAEWWQALIPSLDAAARAEVDASQADGARMVEVLQRSLGSGPVLEAMARAYRVPCLALEDFRFDAAAIQLIPEDQARRFQVLPLFLEDTSLYVAFRDPADVNTRDYLQRKTGKSIEPVVVLPADLTAAINRVYLTPEMVAGKMAGYQPEVPASAAAAIDPGQVEGDAPAVKVVETLIAQGINLGASDVHIEPYAEACTVRYRVDGVLHTFPAPSLALLPAIIGRIKILGGMDVAQRRVPQDGRYSFPYNGVDYDLRISMIPTEYSEATVIRILRGMAGAIELDDLGFSPPVLARWKRVLERPNSIVLVTGPTGSGKTTTLYATLKYLWSPELKIVTIEEPVEFRLPGIVQFPVRAESSVTFSNILRSVLRHDPDIIMLGEIRDAESAEIALRASLTGHLVLSTLHTNDAPTAMARLVDMGIPSWLVIAAVSAVLAQRLVRRLCPRCKTPRAPSAEERDSLGLTEADVVYDAVGCESCKHIGYHGRVALYELLEMTPRLRHAAHNNLSPHHIRRAARKHALVTLRDSGLAMVRAGITSVSEVAPVAMEVG